MKTQILSRIQSYQNIPVNNTSSTKILQIHNNANINNKNSSK